MEQSRLLLGLLQAQQAAAQPAQPSSSAAPASKPYVDPKCILEEVGPQIRTVFQEFEAESKSIFFCVGNAENQATQIWKVEAEAKHQWQFTKLYIAHAQRLENEQANMNDDCDLKEAWSSMRRRHAK